MKARNVLAAITAMGLVTLPVAAQAGTRAEAAMPSAGVRKSASVKKNEELNAGSAVLAVAGAGLVVFGLIKLFDDDDKKSNGAA